MKNIPLNGMQPFNGDFIDKDGNIRNLIENGEAPATHPKHSASPINAAFYSSNGEVHTLDEVLGGNIAGWKNLFASDSFNNLSMTGAIGLREPLESNTLYALNVQVGHPTVYNRFTILFFCYIISGGGPPNPYCLTVLSSTAGTYWENGVLYCNYVTIDADITGMAINYSAIKKQIDLATQTESSTPTATSITHVWKIATAI